MRRRAARSALYTDVWVSMGDEDTADHRRAALAPYRIDDALLDAAGSGRDRAALPARPPGRGDHRRGALRLAPANLGSGREPPPCPEGAAGAFGRAIVAMTVRLRKPAPSLPPTASTCIYQPRAGRETLPKRPERGEEIELQIDSLAHGGEGVGRLGDGGYVVFVSGALPGDRVRAVVVKRKRSYAHARLVEVLRESPERIAPTADHPGVAWQVLPYERQLQIKRNRSRMPCGASASSTGSSWRDCGCACRNGATATSLSIPGVQDPMVISVPKDLPPHQKSLGSPGQRIWCVASTLPAAGSE